MRQNALTQTNVMTADVERQYVAQLIDGVAKSSNPAEAYGVAVREAESRGIDIPDGFETYDPENFEIMRSLYSMPQQELTDFQRMMQGLSPEDQRRHLRIRAGLEPDANAVMRGQVGDRPLSWAGKLRSDLEAGHILQEDFDRETTRKRGLRVGRGGVIEVDRAPLGRAASNAEQKSLASEINLASQLDNVGRLAGLDENGRMADPWMLTYAGQAEDFLVRHAEKLGVEPTDLQREAVFKRTQFVTGVEQLFNAYRKEITGAAAAVQELDRLKKSFINMDMSPTQFEAAFAQYSGELKRSMRIRRRLLREGFDLREEGGEGGEMMDNLFLAGADDDPAARYEELLQELGDEDQVYQRMAEEGYAS